MHIRSTELFVNLNVNATNLCDVIWRKNRINFPIIRSKERDATFSHLHLPLIAKHTYPGNATIWPTCYSRMHFRSSQIIGRLTRLTSDEFDRASFKKKGRRIRRWGCWEGRLMPSSEFNLVSPACYACNLITIVYSPVGSRGWRETNLRSNLTAEATCYLGARNSLKLYQAGGARSTAETAAHHPPLIIYRLVNRLARRSRQSVAIARPRSIAVWRSLDRDFSRDSQIDLKHLRFIILPNCVQFVLLQMMKVMRCKECNGTFIIFFIFSLLLEVKKKISCGKFMSVICNYTHYVRLLKNNIYVYIY